MEKQQVATVSDKEIRQNVLSMIIPVTIEGILQMISSTVIMAMLGRVDVLAVNAVGIGTRFTQVLWAFARGIGVGITVCVARDVGAKKRENLKLTSIVGVLSLAVIVALFSLFSFIFTEPIVGMFGGNPDTIAKSIVYMRIVLIGLPFWSFMLSTAGILQGHGDAKTPMMVAVVYNCINIALGYCLIFGKFGFPELGLYGAAISTVVAQILICVVSCVILIKKKIMVGMVAELKKDWKNTIGRLKYLYKVGIPTAMENVLWQAGSMAMMRPIISYGDIPYATHQLALQAESISYMPTMGFGIATTSLVGRCFGAQNYADGHKYFKKIFKYMAIVSAITMVIMVLFRTVLMGILTPSAEIIKLGAIYLIITACTLIPQNLHGVYCGALRGAGYTKAPMYIAIVCLWGIRVTLAYVFAYLIPDTNIIWIWLAMSVDITMRFVLAFAYFNKVKIFKTGGRKLTD